MPGTGPIYLVDEKYQRYHYKAGGSLFLGAHEIKAGLDWEHLSSDFSESYGGTDRIRYRLTADGSAPQLPAPLFRPDAALRRELHGEDRPDRAGGVPELHGLHDRADRGQQPDDGQRRPLRAGLLQGPEEPHDQRRSPLRAAEAAGLHGEDPRVDRQRMVAAPRRRLGLHGEREVEGCTRTWAASTR